MLYIYGSGGAACGIKKYQTLENGRFVTISKFHHCAGYNNDTGDYEPYFTIGDEYDKEVSEEIYNRELQKAENNFCQNDVIDINVDDGEFYSYSEITDILNGNYQG